MTPKSLPKPEMSVVETNANAYEGKVIQPLLKLLLIH